MLAAMGLCYGSDDAIDFSVEVHKALALAAYRSSVNLAKDRGPFAIFDAQKEKNNPFIRRLANEDKSLYDDMLKFGRRNIALLTIAPTGTTSLMTQTTSGIEPVFMPVYKRRRKVNPNDTDVNIAFTDEIGDSWEEYNVFHQNFITWLKVNGYNIDEVKNYDDKQIAKIIKKSPYDKASSNDVDWHSKVKMQGQIQKWVDHSISVTINLPKDVTEELVAELYIEAWKNGCKGVTVYRDGSRAGVLIASDNEKGERRITPKRPKVIEADIQRFKNNKEDWIAFIGLTNDEPYEVFTGMVDEDVLFIPKSVDSGKIIKNKDENGKSRYDFQYFNKYGYKTTVEGLSHKFNKEFWNYAKLISGVLRHGMPIKHVVNLVTSLQLDSETINTWKNGVERALKRYIPNGTIADNGQECDSCGSDQLIYQEGCLICKSCGASKCG